MKRLFFALWPDEKTRRQIHQLNQAIPLKHGKKHPPNNLHVTLVFLGNIDVELEIKLLKLAGQLASAPFQFSLDKLDYWSKPRILCLTASQQPESLCDLVIALTDMAQSLGIAVDKRPYQAHVTLMRKAKSDYSVTFNAIEWQAKEFVLAESVSTESGVEYKVLARWPL